MRRFSSDELSVKTITISQRHEGQRLDNFLIRELKGVPRSRVYRLIRRGEVRVNKKRCKPEFKLGIGDKLRVPPVRINSKNLKSDRVSPVLVELFLSNILHETGEFLVLNKPSGFPVQGGTKIQVNIIDALRSVKSEWKELELAHRLDKDTSGCLIVAKNMFSLRHLQLQFKLKTIKKVYHAIVFGDWPSDLRTVDEPLVKNRLSSGERVVKVGKEGKGSKTNFRVIKRLDGATLLEINPETGRTHQIRVHCQYAGFPIIGDSKYSTGNNNSNLKNTKKLCLHAAEISFKDPISETPVEVCAPIDKHFGFILNNINQ